MTYDLVIHNGTIVTVNEHFDIISRGLLCVKDGKIERLDTLEANVEGTRADLDSEFLHDLRVATRRTRSALSQIKAVLPAEITEAIGVALNGEASFVSAAVVEEGLRVAAAGGGRRAVHSEVYGAFPRSDEPADASPLGSKSFYVLGRQIGRTNLSLYNAEDELMGVINIEVTFDTSGVKEALRSVLPHERISVKSVNGRLLLQGEVRSATAVARAMQIAKDFAGDSVTNAMSVGASQQVQLEVRFIEANRNASRDLGVNYRVNAGGISYASYRVAHLMEELINYQPDLFIIYTGHNEFLEERTYGQIKDIPPLVRSTLAVLSKTRTWAAMTQALQQVGVNQEPEQQDKDTMAVEVDTILDRSAGLGLGEPITRRLCADNWRHVGDAELAGCRLDVDLAIEFWPLLGDAAEQAGGSRLVDASTKRLQLTLRTCGNQDTDLDGWRLLAGNYRVPLRREQDDTGVVLITGLRYRAFVPWVELHPGLDALTPIVLYLLPPGGKNGLRCTLHDWQPEGKPYNGLPDNLDEARRRIAERFVVEEISLDQAPDAVNPPDEAVSDYCLDLRRT